MNIEDFCKYCIKKKGVIETFPFDETTLVYKVGSKMFALTDLETIPFRMNLKCDPEESVELREKYEGIIPGWHMNKKHWNTVIPDQNVPDKLVFELIDKSYDLVYKSLKKTEKLEIEKEK